MPVKHSLGRFVYNLLKNLNFRGSGSYWSDRYERGGNSGVGSYGRFAEFKADFINRLVQTHAIRSVVELGSGDGHQASKFFVPRYIGLDVAPAAVELCRQQLADKANFECHLYDPVSFSPSTSPYRADLALSLDVIYHLTEDETYERYLAHLFALAERYVVVYSSNKTVPRLMFSRHVRHRRFTDDVAAIAPEWRLVQHLPNPYPPGILGYGGSFADFFVFEKASITS